MIGVGVDVGGTFTDLVFWDEGAGTLTAVKVPSTPGHEQDGFLDGMRSLGDAGAGIRQIIHGTTVATNALLERRGGRVALLTTAGFRDVLEIGRCMRYAPNSLFDTKFVKPAPLVERPLRFEVKERVGFDGTVIVPLTDTALAAAIAELQSAAPDAIAIGFINAYANDAHERAVKARLAAALPNVRLCTSTEVHRGYHEFERFATAALNAYLMPAMARYLDVLEQSLRQAGISAPVLIMGSSGGTISPRDAAHLPVRTILSGPVGGVAAAIRLSAACGIEDAITYDMGGTSTDVSVIRKGEALSTNQVVYAGLPVRGAMVEINTVGAGAGSIARRDTDGALLVGPQSAGAVPGPVCYGAGGDRVTVTDANLLLGRLNAQRPLGDRIELKLDKSRAALEALAEEMGNFTAESLAEGIIRIATAKMVGAIREISVSRGLDPRGFTLIAYGGAGPMHAALVAADLGVKDVLVPPLPGNFSALGLLTSDLRWEMAETLFSHLDAEGVTAVNAAIAKLEQEGRAHLSADGVPPEAIRFETWAEMHYTGQASQFAVRLPGLIEDAAALRALFLTRYEERYGHSNAARTIAIDAVRVVAVAPGNGPAVGAVTIDTVSAEPTHASREVYFAGAFKPCTILARANLAAGRVFLGPAIVEESGSTTLVPPGWHVSLDALGNLRLSAEAERD